MGEKRLVTLAIFPCAMECNQHAAIVVTFCDTNVIIGQDPPEPRQRKFSQGSFLLVGPVCFRLSLQIISDLQKSCDQLLQFDWRCQDPNLSTRKPG